MVSEIGASAYSPYQPSRSTQAALASQAQTGQADPTNKAAETSVQRAEAAIISAPRVSAAVQNTLLQLQETGSVFDVEDRRLMNLRGVSDTDRQRFAQIVQEAANADAYNDPVAFIQSLPPEDVEVLRRVHSLAETRGVTDTDTVEGAVNLLLPPHQHVDINDDGLVTNGMAVGFHFPPPNAPQSVKDAWDETTKHMSPDEKMLASGVFLTVIAGANVKTDANGTVIGLYDHTDPEYTNPFGTTDQDWDALLEKMIAEFKEGVKRDPSLRDRLDLLMDFAANLTAPADDVGESLA